jgi:glycosyltransferase involved in cell wall biosynthesis
MYADRDKLLVLAGCQHSLLNFRRNLLIALTRTLSVQACAPEDNPDWTQALRDIGVDYSSIPFVRDRVDPVADLGLLYRYRRLIKQEQPAALFAYTIKPIIYGSLAAVGTQVKVFVLVTGLGYSFSDDNLRTRKVLSSVVSSLYRSALRRADHVFFQNPDDVQLFLERKILRAAASFSVIDGSGVDLNQFRATPPKHSPIRFLMMARLIRSKGIAEYIEAASLLKRTYPDAEFWLLGERQPRSPDAFEDRVLDAACATGCVRYLGVTENVVPFLDQSSVYVLPSYYREGVPRSILEALAVGRAIVTTDRPGCKETVVPGKNGYLIPARDPKALASVLERFLQHPELIVAMGRASRAIAEETYDDRKVNQAILRSMGLTLDNDRAQSIVRSATV